MEDNFTDGNFTSNPIWQGDAGSFVVNTQGQLQLMAPAGGSASLFSQGNIPDSAVWKFWVNLNFAPSTSNYLKLYLMSDQPALTLGNGYYILVGESGNVDALKLYRQDGSTSVLLGTATVGAMAVEPAKARVKVVRKINGDWTVSADYAGGQAFVQEFTANDDTYQGGENKYFGMYCFFSESRKDQYFFDDISILPDLPDTQPPSVVSASALDSLRIEVLFDEALQSTAALDLTKYTISNGIGQPVESALVGSGNNKVLLRFATLFENGEAYTLTVQGMKDELGNTQTQSQSVDFEYLFVSVPLPGDLIVNELLFNPDVGGTRYIELYNKSNKIISLKNCFLADYSKSTPDVDAIVGDILVYPGEYPTFTSVRTDIISRFDVPNENWLYTNTLPTWGDTDGNVSLLYKVGTTQLMIDSFDYSDEWHSPFLNSSSREGVALERVFPDLPATASTSWASAAGSRPGTPTGKNSQFRMPGSSATGEVLSVTKSLFSPDGDGYEDYLEIVYNTPLTGYTASMTAFDSDGNKTKSLIREELAGTSGILRWDGDTDNGEKARPGIYIIYFELFLPSGEVNREKKTVALVYK